MVEMWRNEEYIRNEGFTEKRDLKTSIKRQRKKQEEHSMNSEREEWIVIILM